MQETSKTTYSEATNPSDLATAMILFRSLLPQRDGKIEEAAAQHSAMNGMANQIEGEKPDVFEDASPLEVDFVRAGLDLRKRVLQHEQGEQNAGTQLDQRERDGEGAAFIIGGGSRRLS
jgi:hypothetical protein